mmetsp:Transcript_9542/g.28822  ORF Transcript_9542/g.28822 Transcript_9542/m.28822 type:complete len:82 (-) Transcript_9542:361-606(-)
MRGDALFAELGRTKRSAATAPLLVDIHEQLERLDRVSYSQRRSPCVKLDRRTSASAVFADNLKEHVTGLRGKKRERRKTPL